LSARTRQLQDERELEQALLAERFLLFKHSRICPISAHAFEAYGEWAAGAGVPTGWIEVREQRPLARRVADATGVRHESPQALLLSGGRAVWHASHGGISLEALKAAAG
jgi:bacillithiol system protein YtxJ